MLEIKAFGGLGNQMFQYSFMKYLGKCNKVCLNISDFDVHNHHHGYELERVFNIDSSLVSSEASKLQIRENGLFIRGFRKLLNVEINSKNVYLENKELSFVRDRKYDNDIFFVGFWQDYRYVDSIKTQIMSDFTFKESLDEKNRKFIENVSNRETVSIHVRRGDYLNALGLGEVCGKEYYDAAIEYMEKSINNPLFIIFSDDIEWCKKLFCNIDAVYVDWNVGENSYVDMHLMSLCKHNIIANSTFSWWGAYLNIYQKKKVICPKVWNRKYSENRLACPDWILL